MSESIIRSLVISALAHDGRGIAFFKNGSPGRGQAIFIAGALPGQTVSCRVEKDHGSWLEGKLHGVETSSGLLTQPLCPHQDECGGCPWQLMPYTRQMLWKERLACDSLTRIGGYEEEQIQEIWQKIIPAPELEHFRNKIELGFGEDKTGALCLGFRQRASHEIAPVHTCAITPVMAMRIAKDCLSLARDLRLPSGFWQSLLLRQSVENGESSWVAVCRTSQGSSGQNHLVAGMGRELLANGLLKTFIHEVKKEKSGRRPQYKRLICLNQAGEKDPAAAQISLPLLERNFTLDAASFFQTNSGASQLFAELARQNSRGGKGLLDLYCGVGAPGLLLADRYQYCLGVEADGACLPYARKNAQAGEYPLRYRFLAGEAGRILQAAEWRHKLWSTVLLDPPRAGLEEKALAGVLASAAENIIYLSCNPVTFARDVKKLGSGYRLTSVQAVDMFPHTPHLELCGCLHRL